MFQLLLGSGVDVGVHDNDGMSALMWCCHGDRVDHMRLLLEHLGQRHGLADADWLLSDRDVTGRSCLHWAVRRTEPLRCLEVSPVSLIVHS